MLLDKSNHKCQICGKSELINDPATYKKISNLCVDHCHESMRVRGILCRSCNSGLGYFKDSENLLKLAVKYLQDNTD